MSLGEAGKAPEAELGGLTQSGREGKSTDVSCGEQYLIGAGRTV